MCVSLVYNLIQFNLPGHFCSVPLQKQCYGQAGIATTEAEAAKRRKYDDLLNIYCFQPVAIETTGVHTKSTATF